ARTAESASVDGIIIPLKGSAAIHSDAVKTSSGALNHLPVCRIKKLTETVKYLQQCGITVVAGTEKAEAELYKTDFTSPLALVLGSEESGVSNELLKIVDKKCKIP
ncbi:MAG: 23S rRNA (guanosine(2251)-2'-O)-methyltransferase RlmB, partial [Aliifodinibius sp.]|nr:RNA methyltransferase [Fodinibius sp.]NIV16464.1 23S rRNA (guanosine(2251)-2'-O)-methyltransferase RlmB [Fodinibius sp.]NIY30422.1 23S rRNA (guanosine(2251)-2'-O)-methyltransferase RlmB [Fodinibius sp.]